MSQLGSDPKAFWNANPAGAQFISTGMRSRGFLPEHDPLISFPSNSEFGGLDEIGRDLPSLLRDPSFRAYARSLDIPLWPENRVSASDVPELRLYYLRVGFFASAYINQVGQEPLATSGYCSDAILLELGRTPGMKTKMKSVGFIPKAPEETRNYKEPRPTRSNEVLGRFGIVLPKPKSPLPQVIAIGSWRRNGKEIHLTRAELFERVWAEAVDKLAQGWGLSGRGLGKACARLQIPVPPRGFWAKAEHGHKVRRPRLPDLKPGEAETVVIYAPL